MTVAASRIDAALRGVDLDDSAALEGALSRLDAGKLPDAEAVLLLRLRALAASRQGRPDEAATLLDVAVARAPDDPDLHLQRGVLLEQEGRVNDAMESFRLVGAGAEEAPARVLAVLRFHYLWDRPRDGQNAIEPLFALLRDLGRGDDASLRNLGLPPFFVLMAHYTLFARMGGRPKRVPAMLEWAATSLRGAPVESVAPLLLAFADDDEEGYAAWLESWALAPGTPDEPAPARRVAWALHRARTSASVGRALQHVDSVTLEPDAPPWLEDLRTFGRAETFHRHGMAEDESPWRTKLLRGQPLLFEPEHVVRFGLFGYQERLKESYRELRAT